MSRLIYFASDTVLGELPNPYIKLLSVNQAMELGIEVNIYLFDKNYDRDEPDVILLCEDETNLGYPNIYTINKEKYYDDIGTSKKFCTTLQWNYSEDTLYVVFEYIQEHMKKASELELWSVWLGGEEIKANIRKTRCKLNEFTVERLKGFFINELDYKCFVVIK